jgi:hypothetical protein
MRVRVRVGVGVGGIIEKTYYVFSIILICFLYYPPHPYIPSRWGE